MRKSTVTDITTRSSERRQTHSERNASIAYEFQTYKSYTSPFTGSIDIDNCLSNILAMSTILMHKKVSQVEIRKGMY
jgi:hypothetical protein